MKTYLVGGAVRDQLLNFPYHERDWVVVGATANEMLDAGFQPVGKDFPVFIHPKTKEEYALARTERKSGKGYTGFDCFSSPDVTLEEDLQRRDLTINAMAQDDDGQIIDPYGGQTDLDNKVLRHVSDAFIEDPLRVLRIARFYARYAHLGFTVADETLQLMQTIAENDELLHLTPERIWKELERGLGEKSPQCFIQALIQCNALKPLLPEWQNLDKGLMDCIESVSIHADHSLYAFSILCSELAKELIDSLCQRLKIPNAFYELATLMSQYGSAYSATSNDAAEILKRLEALDAFRRHERLQHFFDCCQLLYPTPEGIAQLSQALKISQSINSQQFLEQGLKGKAIGQALKQQRIKAIETLL
jgi:tRNA nucleotidyltransferase (CCA-adding enzyme)